KKSAIALNSYSTFFIGSFIGSNGSHYIWYKYSEFKFKSQFSKYLNKVEDDIIIILKGFLSNSAEYFKK
ncbi:hypothetical protein L0P50_19810, partial [Lawsonibacter sp. DFI.6.74]|nr:hypothetical protein [Lawsonibacter sp. DFI.6.74]